jgi:hypothetical protein
MAEKLDKKVFPPYVSFKSFISFINSLRDSSLPTQIDRSMMRSMSGAQQSAMISGLRYFRLIDENDRPTALMKQVVEASDENQKDVLKPALETAYSFLFGDGEFDLDRATGQQLADKFREQGISGSTVIKSISFFLAAAKAVGIKYSTHIKPPQATRNGAKRSAKRQETEVEAEEFGLEEEDLPEDKERFEIPIPGKASAVITIPKDLTTEDWEMLTTMFAAYVKRLQAQNQK